MSAHVEDPVHSTVSTEMLLQIESAGLIKSHTLHSIRNIFAGNREVRYEMLGFVSISSIHV
jgi:hypothetical protein